jgi:hypothetical protein
MDGTIECGLEARLHVVGGQREESRAKRECIGSVHVFMNLPITVKSRCAARRIWASFSCGGCRIRRRRRSARASPRIQNAGLGPRSHASRDHRSPSPLVRPLCRRTPPSPRTHRCRLYFHLMCDSVAAKAQRTPLTAPFLTAPDAGVRRRSGDCALHPFRNRIRAVCQAAVRHRDRHQACCSCCCLPTSARIHLRILSTQTPTG